MSGALGACRFSQPVQWFYAVLLRTAQLASSSRFLASQFFDLTHGFLFRKNLVNNRLGISSSSPRSTWHSRHWQPAFKSHLSKSSLNIIFGIIIVRGTAAMIKLNTFDSGGAPPPPLPLTSAFRRVRHLCFVSSVQAIDVSSISASIPTIRWWLGAPPRIEKQFAKTGKALIGKASHAFRSDVLIMAKANSDSSPVSSL